MSVYAVAEKVKDKAAELFSKEKRVSKRVSQFLNIADRVMIEAKANQLTIDRCVEHQTRMLNNLESILDCARKMGNKAMYVETGKMFSFVSAWRETTKKMANDRKMMFDLIAMVRLFYKAFLEYKEVVEEFVKTTATLASFKSIGAKFPEELGKTSAVAARHFQELVENLSSVPINYTGLSDLTLLDVEDEWSKKFDEERQLLAEKHDNESNRTRNQT